jgi:hypothetical protein
MKHPTTFSLPRAGSVPFERYRRHGRRHGPSHGLWLCAPEDGHNLACLANELGVKLPPEWRKRELELA